MSPADVATLRRPRISRKPVGVLGLDSGLAPRGEESLQAFVPKGLDRHGAIVTRNWSRYNPHSDTLRRTAARQTASDRRRALALSRAPHMTPEESAHFGDH